MAVSVSAGGQKMPLCLSWGTSSSEPLVPTGHEDREEWPLSGHLCGLMSGDQVLTPNPVSGYCVGSRTGGGVGEERI